MANYTKKLDMTNDRDSKLEIKNLHIGEKIRDLRKKKGFVLEDLSNLTGLSKPLLSRIEKESILPPLPTLLKISKALDLKLNYFFSENVSGEKVVLIRKNEYKILPSRFFGRKESGHYYEALAEKRSGKKMEPFLMVAKRKKEEKLSFFSHKGEEFIFVLEGIFEFRAEGEVYVLYPGDCLYFDAGILHSYRALGKRDAKALFVVCTIS